MASSKDIRLAFPCDCLSSTSTCQESWVQVAKQGMFKNGTKEKLLNALASGPRTIAQLSKLMRLAQPTVFRHISDLAGHRLLREARPATKQYSFERYYKPNFPVFSRADQRLLQPEIEALSREIGKVVRKRLPRLKARFAVTNAVREGWAIEEIAQYFFHAAQREARADLEKEGDLARKFESAGLNFAFWGTEQNTHIK